MTTGLAVIIGLCCFAAGAFAASEFSEDGGCLTALAVGPLIAAAAIGVGMWIG
jgi:hypothetical protein